MTVNSGKIRPVKKPICRLSSKMTFIDAQNDHYILNVFFTWGHMHFILKCPKFEQFHFRFISRLKTSHVSFFLNAPFFCSKKIRNAPLFLSYFGNGKMGHFNNFSYRKTENFEKRHVISLNEKTRNEPKMELFEFGVFKKIHMASREKYIFHMLFGAFHDTPRTWFLNLKSRKTGCTTKLKK